MSSAWLRQGALAFAAGCGGGLAQCAAAWGAARLGATVLVGAHGAAALSPGVLYPRIVWGGVWGLLFLLAWLRGPVPAGGLVAGLIVTAMQWLLLPLWWHGGLHLALLPLLGGLLLNLIWGWAAALLLKWL